MYPSSVDRLPQDDWSLADCLRILYRRKATVAAIASLGILAAALICALRPHTYRSRASLEIQGLNESYLDLRDVYPAASPAGDNVVYIQTQVEMLQQDNLFEQVGRKLNLENLPEYRSPRGLVARLREDVSILPIKNSRIVQIICDARSASLAANVANTLAETFIDQNIRMRQDAARQTYQSLLPQLAELRSALRSSPEVADHGSATAREDVNRHMYAALLQKADYAWLASRLNSTNIRLIDRAEPAATFQRPNLPLTLGIGLLGGLLLAVGWVMLQEQHRDVVRVPGDAGACLALPELGAIPQAGGWTPPAFVSYGFAKGELRIQRVALEQRAELSEPFRAIATSVLSSGIGGGQARLLVVTSCQPLEGKTTVVSNLGIALAAIGQKVLLIDADLHRPRLHKLFDASNSWGLSDVLREKNAIEELPLDVLAKKTSVPHLYLLPSGATTDNIFGLLHSERMTRLLPLFRKEFDYVLVDAPPCLEFADARIMARYAEKLVLVVRANYTDRRTAQAAVERLRLDGLPLMGVILNRWHPSPGYSYAYRTSGSQLRQAVS